MHSVSITIARRFPVRKTARERAVPDKAVAPILTGIPVEVLVYIGAIKVCKAAKLHRISAVTGYIVLERQIADGAYVEAGGVVAIVGADDCVVVHLSCATVSGKYPKPTIGIHNRSWRNDRDVIPVVRIRHVRRRACSPLDKDEPGGICPPISVEVVVVYVEAINRTARRTKSMNPVVMASPAAVPIGAVMHVVIMEGDIRRRVRTRCRKCPGVIEVTNFVAINLNIRITTAVKLSQAPTAVRHGVVGDSPVGAPYLDRVALALVKRHRGPLYMNEHVRDVQILNRAVVARGGCNPRTGLLIGKLVAISGILDDSVCAAIHSDPASIVHVYGAARI